ncbi:hypothetical protein SPRG_13783 [Saprolegnia parasitica CBS 223.65]|uniref:Uncharacterized protein n=1 Tax=Saprolegnia parasitica (strain CBS 223.65) TaxID=695850 RepID=A0A067C3E4_SAPPC|nr:hypothetical protein SPRG_13783 [Saprolegnia parasitica CBS 223.65]KDO21076.1 hypothetical protein SPRG_13783 [Saprolegnia parasitica CBS 223.65]|eukprot:XP_012208174.1 hypothetical protein SPRG_13783 [Saprolegnia parasitica CBS 223.65]
MPKKAVSLEDAILQGVRPTTPRALEACLRTGIEPDEIIPRLLEDFLHHKHKHDDVEREAAHLRFTHFEEGRQTKIGLLRREKQKLVDAGFTGSPILAKLSPKKKTISPFDVFNASAPDKVVVTDSTMMEMEEKRFQAMKIRQEREIASIIEMETRMAEILKQNALRDAQEAKRKAEWEKEKKERRAALVAAKHEREILKKKSEDAEAAARRQRAKREAEKEKILLEEERRQEKLRHREMAEREMDRKQKAELHRRQTEELLQQQENKIMENRRRVIEREEQAQKKMAEANERRRQEAAARREKANARIQAALDQNQNVMLKKKQDFEQKQELAAARAMEVHRKEMQELKDRAERNRKEEEIRLQRVEAARNNQSERVDTIVKKRHQLETHLDVVYTERSKERTLKSVERDLTLEEKKANVERLKKVEEFNRIQTLLRISEEDERSRMIKIKKQALIDARKKIALESLVRKHRIAEAVGNMRISNKWDNINEIMEGSTSPDRKNRKKKMMSSKSASDIETSTYL